jgi:transcriptional regulator of acetoin/glycerol metabolism
MEGASTGWLAVTAKLIPGVRVVTRTIQAHVKRPRHAPASLPAIVRAVLDAREEQIAVFDADIRVLYLNARASGHAGPDGASADGAGLRAKLLARRGRAVTLQSGGAVLGEILLVPNHELRPWAHREREAIRETLARAGGKRGETARRLGISRTTLWRRLRENGTASRALAT